MWGGGGGGFTILTRSLGGACMPHTGVLGSGRSPSVRPTVQARGASLCCPSTSAMCTLGQTLARCPRTTLEVGWWLRGFRRASPTVVVQRARHRHVAPRVVCVLGLSQLVMLAAARWPPRSTQLGNFPRKGAPDARLPPSTSRHAQSGNRSNDLSVARPTLSPVEFYRDPCVCGGGGVLPFLPGLPD